MNAALVLRTAHSYAYEMIREQILTGVLAPGAPLIQTVLAADLSISMTPVREALRDLASEGLVTQTPHRGAVVTRLDAADAIEITEIRLALEPDALARASLAMRDEDLAACEDAFQRLESATPAEWVPLTREFHTRLLAPTPSRRLRSVLESLIDFAALYVGEAARRRDEVAQVEHRQILEAMARRDAPAVADLARRHFEHILEALHEAEDLDRAAETGGRPGWPASSV